MIVACKKPAADSAVTSAQDIESISGVLSSDKDKENFYQKLGKLQAAGILPMELTSRFDYVSYFKPL